MIVDAGGGTVDISTYSRTSDDQSFEEIATPACSYSSRFPEPDLTILARCFRRVYICHPPRRKFPEKWAHKLLWSISSFLKTWQRNWKALNMKEK